MSLGALSVAMYGATACYAIKAPRIPGEGPAKGGIKLHKYLIYIHAPGMILLSMFSMLVLLAFVTAAPGQRMTVTPADPNLENGKAVWNGGCIACHGADGKGAPKSYTVFKRPDTWPDFTRCDQTTSEPDSAYKAVIVHGGRGLGFSQIMPAFGDLLTPTQVDDVIAYLRILPERPPLPAWSVELATGDRDREGVSRG